MEKEKEFTELLFQHQRIIYKVCLLYAKDKDDLADLYQEAVYNLWKTSTHSRTGVISVRGLIESL